MGVDKMKSRKGMVIVSIAAVGLFFGLMSYALQHDPNLLPSQLINKPAPAIAAGLAQGGAFNLQDELAKGRWVIVNFWSTTCIVCREEAPELNSFYQDVSLASAQSPLFVSVNIQESNVEILNYARDFRLTFPIVTDRTGKISLDYGVTGTPETFFIDPKGLVRHRVAGSVDKEGILRFIDWLDKNPGVSADEAIRGFASLRAGRG